MSRDFTALLANDRINSTGGAVSLSVPCIIPVSPPHPSQIALLLPKLIHFIIQSTITQQREIEELYVTTPEVQKRNELGE